jgi:hypothetical protein
MPNDSQPASLFESSLPKQIAVAIAAGGKLVRTEPDSDGRLRFCLENVVPDFELRLARDEVLVSGAKVIAAMEMVLTLINAHQRRGGRR